MTEHNEIGELLIDHSLLKKAQAFPLIYDMTKAPYYHHIFPVMIFGI